MPEPRTNEGVSTQLKRIAIALLIAGAVFGLFKGLDAYVTSEHLGELPPGYQVEETEAFEVFFAPDRRESARRVLREGERFLERFPRVFAHHLGDLEPPSSRIRLTLFRDHGEFTRFARKSLRVDMSNNGGYCDPANQEIVLVLSQVERDLASLTSRSLKDLLPETDPPDVMAIRHELVHYLMERGGGEFATQIPPWLGEGLACAFETADLADDRLPGLPSWTKIILAITRHIPTVGQVVDLRHGSYRSGANSLIYAFSHLLVRFLWKEDASLLWRYVRLLRSGQKATWEGFKRHFAFDQAMEGRWQSHIQAGRVSARREIGANHPPGWLLDHHQ